jgi:hypothetical protein
MIDEALLCASEGRKGEAMGGRAGANVVRCRITHQKVEAGGAGGGGAGSGLRRDRERGRKKKKEEELS